MLHDPFRPEGFLGSPAPVRGLFVDRWGTLLERPDGGDPRGPQDLRFLPGAVDALFRAQRAGWRIYLVGNEDAVAFGRLAEADWARFEGAMLSSLADQGVCVTRNYACLDHPRGVPARRSDSVFRLPNTGAFYHAKHHDGTWLEGSWLVGDSTLEHAAAWRAGLKRAGVRTGEALADGCFDLEGYDLVESDLPSVVGALLLGRWTVAA
jgi:histidinol phosphatase-like enzyme